MSNQIIAIYKNNGDEVINISEGDYIQVKLFGNYANEVNAHMLISINSLDILKYKWYLGKHGYPITYQSCDKTQQFGIGIKLHQMLLGYLLHLNNSDKMVIDHINRNKLDNRIENLRICSPKQNSYNTSKRNGKYKGVKKQGKTGKWIASISKDCNKYQIKDIASEKEAAYMYDMLAESFFGEYAGKNFN
jgi:hypothetical protein